MNKKIRKIIRHVLVSTAAAMAALHFAVNGEGLFTVVLFLAFIVILVDEVQLHNYETKSYLVDRNYQMTRKMNENLSFTIEKDRIYLHLKKFAPIAISAEDKFRKGIELVICSRCNCAAISALSEDNKEYCLSCTEEIAKEGNK